MAGVVSGRPGVLAAEEESAGLSPARVFFVARVVSGRPGGLEEEAADSLSVVRGGLAAAAASEVGSAPAAVLQVRAFLAAEAVSAAAAAVVEVMVLRALVGEPLSACLAAFLGLAAVCPPWRIIAALPRV